MDTFTLRIWSRASCYSNLYYELKKETQSIDYIKKLLSDIEIYIIPSKIHVVDLSLIYIYNPIINKYDSPILQDDNLSSKKKKYT